MNVEIQKRDESAPGGWTALRRALARYRHRRAFRASLVKRPLNMRLLALHIARTTASAGRK